MKIIPHVVAEQRTHFSVDFLNEETCRLWLLNLLHPEGASCPECGKKVDHEKSRVNFWKMNRVACKECGKNFTAMTATAICGVSLDVRKIYMMILLIGMKRTRREIAEMLQVSIETVRQWEKRLDAWNAV